MDNIRNRVGLITMAILKGIDNLKNKQYILKRFGFSRGGLTCLCGTGCSGKSLFLQYLSVVVSSGLKLFDLFEVEQGKVLYIDQEQTEDQFQLRLERICGGLKISSINLDRMVLSHRIDSAEYDQKIIENDLVDVFSQYNLVIIDSLKATTEMDENSSGIEKVLKLLKRVAEKADCCIVLSHHKGKGKGDVKQSGRGHSSIYDSFDVQIDIECIEQKIYVKCAKMRDGKFFDGLQYSLIDQGRFVESQNCTSELIFSLLNANIVSAGDKQKDKILNNLSTMSDYINNKDLYNIVKGDRISFSAVINKLINEGLVEEKKGIKNSKLVKITEKGMAAFYFHTESSS